MNKEVIRRRHLPHWDVPGASYFVTTCLEDSIPAQGLLEMTKLRYVHKVQAKPATLSQDEWQVRQWKLQFKLLDHWLDAAPLRRDLEQPDLAEQVVNSLFHFAGERYDLLSYVVMPSHIHWVFTPLDTWLATRSKEEERTPREQILYSLNRYTATQCNRLLGRRGSFWQNESYDHWIRDVDELARILQYIDANPVKAGIVVQPDQWRYSSAWYRRQHGLEFGVPLVRVG